MNYYTPDYADVFGGAPRVVGPSVQARVKRRKRKANLKKKSISQGMW
jgi:hypothetical protein